MGDFYMTCKNSGGVYNKATVLRMKDTVYFKYLVTKFKAALSPL